MYRVGMAILVGVLCGVSAAGQTQAGAQGNTQANGQANVTAGKQGAQASGGGAAASSANAQAGHNSAALANGTAISAELTAPVDSKKAKSGDPVKARTTEPCKSNGKTVLPKGTQLVGHVSEASARANGQAESSLGIVFDKAILKNGQEMPLNMAIQALASGEGAASTGSPELEPMGAGGRGALGGVSSTAGGAVGGVTNATANAGNLPNSTVNTATRTTTNATGAASSGAVGGLNAAGQLTSNSRGVFGLSGLNLSSATANGTQGSVITSAGKNVRLDGGTRMLLVTQSAAEASPK
jgi:hypothetical protein